MVGTSQTLPLADRRFDGAVESAPASRAVELVRIVVQNLRATPAERLLPRDAQVIVQLRLAELEQGLTTLDGHLETRPALRALVHELLGEQAREFRRPSDLLRARLHNEGLDLAALRSALGERVFLVVPEPSLAKPDFLAVTEVRSIMRLGRLGAVMSKRAGVTIERRSYGATPITVVRSGEARPVVYQALVGRCLIVTTREDWLCVAIDRYRGVASVGVGSESAQSSLADNDEYRTIHATLASAGRPMVTFYTHLPRFAWMFRLGVAVPDDVPMGIGLQMDTSGLLVTTADNQPLTVPQFPFGDGWLSRAPADLDGRGLGLWLSAPSFRELYDTAKRDFVSDAGRKAWDANFERLAAYGSLHWERDFVDALRGEFAFGAWGQEGLRPVFALAAEVKDPTVIAGKLETLLTRLGATLGIDAPAWRSVTARAGSTRTARFALNAQGPNELRIVAFGTKLVVGMGWDGELGPAVDELCAVLANESLRGGAEAITEARTHLSQLGFSHLFARSEALSSMWQGLLPALGAHTPQPATLRRVEAALRASERFAWMASFENQLSVTRNRLDLAREDL